MDPKQAPKLARQMPLDLKAQELSSLVQCSAFQTHWGSGPYPAALPSGGGRPPQGFLAYKVMV